MAGVRCLSSSGPLLEGSAEAGATAEEVDLAGGQLLGAIDSSCDRALGFPAQVMATLAAALELFASQEDIRCLLPAHGDSPQLIERKIHWQRDLGARLRSAANRGAELAPTPLFLEQILVLSAQVQVQAWIREAHSVPLASRLPFLVDYVLAFYPQAPPALRARRALS